MSEIKQPFQFTGTTVFQLEFDRWRKGEEQMRNRVYAQVYGYRDTPKEELEATARLFSAAPDLLEALKMLVKAQNYKDACNVAGNSPQAEHALEKFYEAIDNAKQAIAKATGGGE